MRWSSLQRWLLSAIAALLGRWLGAVTAQLESAAPLETPPADTRDPRQPAPPDHWVELVQQHAPQLLEPDAPGVIDWRSDAALVEPPQVTARTANARPLRLRTPRPPATEPVPTVRTAPRRPLRLQRVAVQPAQAEEVQAHTAETGEAVTPPVVSAPLHPVKLDERASSDSPQPETLHVTTTQQPDAPQLRETPTRQTHVTRLRETPTMPPDTERIAAHFANLPYERRQVREIPSTLPGSTDLPTIRTRAGATVEPPQRATSVPAAPPQIVLRPTHVLPALNVEQVTPERWPSLPDELPDGAGDPSVERLRRERLKREQEGRLWSE